MRRRSSRGYYDGWAPYVPVAQRRAQAMREMNKLRKKGQRIEPVEVAGRVIASSFWGKGWCTHLESFGDFSNRLPRGRTYVRNGSVCHLGIRKGTVEAIVSGSELYRVSVGITPLKQRCTGCIGSLIELLQGTLSEEIMGTVVDRQNGLFPLPGEIRYKCNCPDWADMCKHIAAVMYGIGARLDKQPDLLFLLRGVNHQELITAEAAVDAIAGGSRRARRRSLSEKDIESVFGVELENTPDEDNVPVPSPRRATRKVEPIRPDPKPRPAQARKKAAFAPTGRSVAQLRSRLGLNKTDFAQAVGVSAATVTNWEKTVGRLKPHRKGIAGLERLQNANR